MPEEEVQEEFDESPPVETEQDEPDGGEQTPSEVEALAIKLGWNPKHEGGDREFVSAEKFILRSKEIQNTMSKQLKANQREVESLKRGIGVLKDHNEKVYNVQVRALKSKVRELEAQKVEAVEDGDTKAATVLENQIRELNEIPDNLPAEKEVEPSQEFLEWVDRNEWYHENEEMRGYADGLGKEYASRNLPLRKVFERVTKEVKMEFPENFEDEPAQKPPVVEGATRRDRSKKAGAKHKFSDLSREQQDIARELEENNIMSINEYIKDLETIEKANQIGR